MTAQQLKNSILQMAVQGKLVPQDPNDEPASVLLERIRAEKERLIKEKKIKREKTPSVIFKGADNTPYEKIGDEMRSLADEVPFDIPDSWEWVRLGSIVYNRGQITPNTDFCYIDIGSIDNKNQKLNSTDTIITPDKAPSRARKLVSKGDILYSTVRPYLHNMCIIDRDFSCAPIASTGFAALTCHADLLNKYLFYYMMSPDFDAYANNTDNAKGVAYPAINDDRLYKALIPIPPLGEQLRIVSAIESVDMPIRDYGVKEKTLRTLNVAFPEALKKSILQEAVQGKLVPQDPSDEPAEALLERIRAEKQRLIKEGKIKKDKHESVIFRRDNSHYEKRGSEEVCIDDEIPFEIPENWTWTRLKYICSLIGDIDHNMPKSVSSDVGVLFLSAKDLLDDGTINYTQNAKYISRADFERLSRKALPQKHDIIYSRIGAALGKARLVEIDREFLVSYSCCVVRPLLVYAPYIRYYLESPQILLHSIKARQSIGVPDLGMGEIKKYLVALPPYNEQVRIVEQLEVLLDRCDFKK